MTPRAYDLTRRVESQAATRLKILEATVALHAEKGGLGTSYADIAKRADVAIPTVYKHFPDLDTLIRGCTGHAMAGAPIPGPRIFDGIPQLPDRIEALVEAVFRSHAYFAPWKRWGEAAHLPVLMELAEAERRELRGLIRLCFAPAGVPSREFLSLAEALLGFAAWTVLKRDPKVPPAKTARTALTALWRAYAKESP